MLSPHSKRLVSLVIPTYNEGDAISVLFARLDAVLPTLNQYDFEIVCVNDGSTDQSLALLKQEKAARANLVVVDLRRNFGKEAALSAGLFVAAGDAVVSMDADLQDPPEVVKDLLAKWEEGFEVVLGRRTDRSSDSMAKRFSAQSFYRIHNVVADVELPADVGDFRLMDRVVVEALNALPEGRRFEKGLFARLGFKTATVDYRRDLRAAGTAKFNSRKLWNFGLEGICSVSISPLKIWTYLGILVALAAGSWGGWIAVRTIVWGGDIPGYLPVLVGVLLLGGLQLIAIGMIGQHLERTFLESKRGTGYLIREIDRKPRQHSAEEQTQASSSDAQDRLQTARAARHTSERAEWKADAIAAGLIAIASGLFLLWAVGDLFPTMEYRDWLAWADRFEPSTALKRMITREEWFSRDFSLSYVQMSSLACGINIGCLNAWVLLPVVVSTTLLYLLARAIGSTIPVAFATTAMWLFSWPMIDAIAWQATIHDRWASVFVLAALWLAVSRYARDRAGGAYIATSLVGLLLVWLASNCKEASWFLAPTMVLIAWAAASGNWRERLYRTSIAWLPMLYLIWHAAAFVVASGAAGAANEANASSGVWLRHVASGDVLQNVKIYSGALLGLTPSSGSVAALILIVLTAFALCFRPIKSVRGAAAHSLPASPYQPLFPLWPLWLGLVGAIAIPIRSATPAPYYMLISSALFSVLALESIRRALLRDEWNRKYRLSDVASIAVAVLMATIFSDGKLAPYRQFREESKNFKVTLDQLVRLPPTSLQEAPFFLHDPAAFRAPYLLFTIEWRSLWRLIPATAAQPDPPWLKDPVRWVHTWEAAKRSAGDGRTYVYMDPTLRLVNFETVPKPIASESTGGR